MTRVMKPLALMVTAATLACGGADAAPEPTQEAAPEATVDPNGVSGRGPGQSMGLPSVVLLYAGEDAAPPPTETVLMDQLGLAFTPRQLMVRPGQPITFVNSEPMAHNVNVTPVENDSSLFYADMNQYDRLELVLDEEGAYDVTCEEHPGMTAFIFVTSAPYAVFTERNGRFFIPDVPDGTYTAEVWTAEGDAPDPTAVEVVGLNAEIDLTAP